MLPPIGIFQNAAPMDASVLRGGFLGFTFSAGLLHEHLLSVMRKHVPPTNIFSDSGDPVGGDSRKITSVDRPSGRCGAFHHRRK